MMNVRSLGTLDVNQTPVLEQLEGETEEEQVTERRRRRRGADVVLAEQSRWDHHGS